MTKAVWIVSQMDHLTFLWKAMLLYGGYLGKESFSPWVIYLSDEALVPRGTHTPPKAEFGSVAKPGCWLNYGIYVKGDHRLPFFSPPLTISFLMLSKQAARQRKWAPPSEMSHLSWSPSRNEMQVCRREGWKQGWLRNREARLSHMLARPQLLHLQSDGVEQDDAQALFWSQDH